MSFSIPGKLNIIEKTGRKGAFMVAELITEVGTFEVKHRVLEEFEQGTYDGVYIITHIFTQSVTWRNGTFTKLCADLDWDSLRIMAQTPEPIASTTIAVAEMVADEAISADHKEEAEAASKPVEAETVSTPAQANVFTDEDQISDMKALNDAISKGLPVKLEGSMNDRNLFRALREQLKKHNYRFDGRTQSWALAKE